ncbi:hypothetical protein SDC9_188648 [bioreactor metagenome]|uniref:Uncharacterized protein n=1 Tax=bioreactor metagenome TaxID=1076179 RepID=A0A645HQ50_9ZZZZ
MLAFLYSFGNSVFPSAAADKQNLHFYSPCQKNLFLNLKFVLLHLMRKYSEKKGNGLTRLTRPFFRIKFFIIICKVLINNT